MRILQTFIEIHSMFGSKRAFNQVPFCFDVLIAYTNLTSNIYLTMTLYEACNRVIYTIRFGLS